MKKILSIICLLCIVLVLTAFTLSNIENNNANGHKFTLLESEYTGVNFNNKVEDSQEHNILIYSNFYGGAGVAIGDINNDGLQDLFFAGNQVGDELYLNMGNMTFKNITESSGIKNNGGWSSGVVMADVNQDGLLDIYVTRELYDEQPELRRNKLYINKGNGEFQEMAEKFGIDNDQRTRHATFFDYDRDGDLDLFLCNQPPNPGDYSPYYNEELIIPEYAIKLYEYDQGSFFDVTVDAGLDRTGFPNSVSVTDINNDGYPDLYIANDFWIEDWIFINTGQGSFTEEIHERVKHISFSSMGVDAGDIDNDGDQDLIVVDMAAEDNYRSKTNMSGMNPKTFWKTVADGGHHQYMFNTLQLNQGDGYYSEVAQLTGMSNTDWSWSPLIADFDNDGWKDVFVTNGLLRDIRNNDASKQFASYIEGALWEYLKKNPNPPEGFTVWEVADINKALDLTPSQKLSNYMFKNLGNLNFEKRMNEWGLEQSTFSSGAAYGDLDNDGDLDLVVNNMNDQAFLYRNNTSELKENNYLRIKLEDPQGSTIGTKVRVYADTEDQYFESTLTRGMYSTSETIIHVGLGQDDVAKVVDITWPDGTKTSLKDIAANQQIQVNHGEAQTDTKLTKTEHSPLFRNVKNIIDYKHKENNFDDYQKQVLLPHKLSTVGPCLSVADINGDDLDDLFIGGSAGKSGKIFLQEEGGNFTSTFSSTFIADQKYEDAQSLFFDVDNDGDEDLYICSGGNEFENGSTSYADRVYINDGSGQFKRDKGRLNLAAYPSSTVKAADFDSDGDLDLFIGARQKAWSYPEHSPSAILRNDNGFLIDVTDEVAPELLSLGMVNDAAWFDHNNDGKQDLIIVGEWMPITILENTGDGFIHLHSQQLAEQSGWWYSIEVADMDADGDQDIVAGNLGLNYKYKASGDEPFEVYYYDFDENGSNDVVLTYYNFGVQYPLRGRECSSEQVPVIQDKFQNYDLFASANVHEVYGEDNLENALHLEANSFASAYIENKGNGNFQVTALPREAQISSINDIITEDFNDDGHLDILTAGNLYNAEVETTRADAGIGLLMIGDGKGNFEALSKQLSGVDLPYNVKSLAKLEQKNRALYIIGCNDDNLQTLSLK